MNYANIFAKMFLERKFCKAQMFPERNFCKAKMFPERKFQTHEMFLSANFIPHYFTQPSHAILPRKRRFIKIEHSSILLDLI